MNKLVSLGVIVWAATSAFAAPQERRAELLLGNGMVVIHFSTEGNDQLADIGDSAKGVLRCYKETNKIHDTGCYIGVRRDGTLVAPAFLPKGKAGDPAPTLIAFAPELAGTYTVTDVSPAPKGGALPVGPAAPQERVEINIGGTLGAALSLYTNCSTKTALHCEDADGEAYRHGQTDPVASFKVAAGGKLVK